MVGYYREFWRGKNKINISIGLDEWPSDVPVPIDAKLAKTGEGPFKPYWVIYLEDDKTVEKVVSWFASPHSLDEVVDAYHDHVIKKGWVENDDIHKGRFSETRWLLVYIKPNTGVRLRVSLQYWTNLNETRAMIERIVIHPWDPENGDELETLDEDLI